MAEVIDFFSAWLDRKVAAVEKEAATVGNSWSLAAGLAPDRVAGCVSA